MALTELTWLIDKSALARLAQSSDLELWSNRIERGLVHITNVTRLEIGYSAQSGDVARRELRQSPLAAMPVEYLTPRIEDRALEVQLLLADRGQHRGPSIPDLIIAATAELSGLTVLHVDKDFDTISAMTGQPTTRLAYTSTDGPGWSNRSREHPTSDNLRRHRTEGLTPCRRPPRADKS